MTISTAPTPLSYSGNGSTTAFPITYKYNAKSHIVATLRSSAGVETVWVLTTNYTLTDPGDTGTLTALVAPATGTTLLITLEPPNTQSSDIPVGGDFPSVVVEDGLDLAAQRDAKVEALFLRALRVPKTDTQTGSLLEIPIDSLRASKFLSFDASGKPIAAAGTSANLGPVSGFINTLLDDATNIIARITLGFSAIAAKGDIWIGTAADTIATLTVGANGTILMARSAASTGLAYVAALNSSGYGTIWSHGTDVTNDFDITAGGCMDATNAYWMATTTIIGKQADVAWAVGGTAGTPLGMLDTGAVGNSDYYIWMIARSDTGVVDFLSSLSSTAPTMPTGYDFKRLRGWFKRVAGVNTLMDVYEMEGGGVEVAWRAPTTEVNIANTLTSTRRTDAVKVPLNFSVMAKLNVATGDVAGCNTRVMCPDETDSAVTNGNSSVTVQVAGVQATNTLSVRTSSAGLIASRASLSTVDVYTVQTNGFTWARRN